jgi:hypothetical protein
MATSPEKDKISNPDVPMAVDTGRCIFTVT